MTEKKTYTFIHIPKCGGTPVEWYFNDHYKEHITGLYHTNTCSKTNNPIIIIRNPIDRFVSLYHYWKNGSHGRNSRDTAFHEKYGNYTIKDFIRLIQTNARSELVFGYTWREHYYPQTHWIQEDTYSGAIVILYEDNLQNKIYDLLNFINVENKFIPLIKQNITRKKKEDEKVTMDEADIEWLKTHFSGDFILWENAKNNPSLFYKVL